MLIPADDIHRVLRQARKAALATHSARHPGFPHASWLPLCVAAAGDPLLLLSQLAEHTQNLQANPQASLLLTADDHLPATEQRRLTLLGSLTPVELEPEEQARYLRLQPDAAQFLALGDFRFYRMQVAHARLIAGFGRMGWQTGAQAAGLPWDARQEHAVLAQLDHPAVLGIDPYGLDYDNAGQRSRHEWPHATSEMTSLLAQARLWCDAH
ncbi:HugZ family pyridoxamine 5'-phosphate oxidase [Leeia aquatica]|uniref:Pyridoxamine 5'-phosphate oxidase n=1 Tax=Leeia aquatica TaxID=2725557 RepID=A0A847RVH0_9NEIS|nr:pyridoxamine 5'-phosphate oxidase family protein [Leeia aquatica]NLR73821.1 pyridoxamine 5'-phosphate oxidase [Leeia aquatica]